MGLLRTANSYSRLDKEDPDELRHRKARFLIYKVLEGAESQRRQSTLRRRQVLRFKVKIGLRLKRLSVAIYGARTCVCRQVVRQVRYLKIAFVSKKAVG